MSLPIYEVTEDRGHVSFAFFLYLQYFHRIWDIHGNRAEWTYEMKGCTGTLYKFYRLIPSTPFSLPKCRNNWGAGNGQADNVQNIPFIADKADLGEHGFAVQLSSFFILCPELDRHKAYPGFPGGGGGSAHKTYVREDEQTCVALSPGRVQREWIKRRPLNVLRVFSQIPRQPCPLPPVVRG